ncbi:hypothetical protein AAF712_007341 [Marasmius tenuissimus]|uniref:F-box domain-containing protein n=1 Tax=Marasmius tenuissimus TaxID=585030 RepID=A0ABR2ZVI5_9AGAR
MTPSTTTTTTQCYCVQCGINLNQQRRDPARSLDLLEVLSTINDPPPATQHAILRKEYKETSLADAALDTDIERLQVTLDVAKRQSAMLKACLPAYKLVLNPIRYLPIEILGNIFRLCVDEDVDLPTRMTRLHQNPSYLPTLDTAQSPWTLGQVCRRWRELVISLPDLWTAVDINWDSDYVGERTRLLIERRVSLLLQRSLDRSLYISWHQDSCQDRILSMLCSRSFQWRAATIRTGLKGLRHLSAYSGLFPGLSELHLHFEQDEWEEQDETDDAFSVFRDTPALCVLTLSGDTLISSRLKRQFPWEQITRFNVKGYSYYDAEVSINVHDILGLLVNVEECFLDYFSFGDHPFSNRITLFKLHSFGILSPSDVDAVSIFQSLTLPKLNSMMVGDSDLDYDPRFAESLIQLLTLSGCQLEKATFYHLHELDLIDILQSPVMQSIHTLSLRGTLQFPPSSEDGITSPGLEYYGVSDEVLCALTLPLPDENLDNLVLPRLRSITLSGDYTVDGRDIG